MIEKERFLVVVSVLEGRKFPKRARHKLLVEARFDGELLATDPVEHSESPDFTQELAWELDKKALHQHRLQRTSVKVQVYTVDTQSTAREVVGYVVLDLRSAHNTQTTKWHQLLHTKYNKHKPEIRLGIYIDSDKGESKVPSKSHNNTVNGQIAMTPRSLRPLLNSTEGYYQIGPKAHCSDHFMLSVTVAFAANLPQLVPSSVPLASTEFFFYYSLLGNDVTNEGFRDLVNPNFSAERASVRIRSSLEAVRDFFNSQPGLEVHLCCGDQSLGSCHIALNALLKDGSTEIYMKPVSIEGAFELVPPARTRQKLPPIPEDMRPMVGVSIHLRKEETSPSEEAQKSSPKISPPRREEGKKVPERKASPRPSSPPATHEGSYTETFESRETTDNVPSLGHDVREKAQAQNGSVKEKVEKTPDVSPVQRQRSPSPLLQKSPPRSPTQQAIPSVPAVRGAPLGAHHFGFSIELRSVRHLRCQHSINAFLRYTYPFFGSSAPVITQPPVEVRPHMEATVPQAYCFFDFASMPQQMHDAFLRIPLSIELWDKQTDKASSVLIGNAQLSLAEVFSSERKHVMNQDDAEGSRQSWSDYVAILSSTEQESVAEVFILLTLEDWGPLNLTPEKRPLSPKGVITHEAPPPAVEAPPPAEPRETLEYRAAMELELWKEQQEQMFEKQLKEKELTFMKALADEWRQRHKDREVLMQKKVTEYRQLEERLQKTVSELDKREKQLVANEQEVLRLRTDLQREHSRKLMEMREASRRLKEDCDHQVQMQKDRVTEHEDAMKRVKQALSEAEARYQQLSKEFAAFREQQNSKPEVRLQSEINLLTLEKVELERKFDAVTKSKVHYKQQWGRALKELARLKERQQTAAKEHLRRQQQELQHMRLRYLAAEEKEVVQTERKQLQDIKAELDHLRELGSEKGLSDSAPLIGSEVASQDLYDEHVLRLVEERDSLLRTGVYTSDDRIIAELDRQIREAMTTKGSSTVQKTLMGTI